MSDELQPIYDREGNHIPGYSPMSGPLRKDDVPVSESCESPMPKEIRDALDDLRNAIGQGAKEVER